MNLPKILTLAQRFKKAIESSPPTQPEGWSDEQAPSTDRPERVEDYPYLVPYGDEPEELEGPKTVRTGPHPDVGKNTKDLVDITVSKDLLIHSIRYLEHRIKIETSLGKKDHAEKLLNFILQLNDWREHGPTAP